MFDKRLWQLAPDAKPFIILSVVWKWVGLLANIAIMVSIGYALQDVFAGQASNLAPRCLAVVALAVAVRAASSVLAQNAGDRAAEAARRQVRSCVYDKLLRLGPSYTQHVATAEAVQMSIEGADQLQVYFGSFLPQLFYALLAPVTLFVVFMALPLSRLAAVVLLVCVPLIPGLIMMVRKAGKAAAAVYWGSYTDLGSLFLEDIQGLTTLKIFQADEARHRNMNQKAEAFRTATMKMLSVQLRSIVAMDLVVFIGAAIGIIVAVMQLSSGAIAFGAAFGVVFLSQEFFLPMRMLGSLFHAAMNGMAASKRMFELLDTPEPLRGAKRLDPGDCTIRCEGVGFSYDGTRQVLHGVDATFEQGSFSAIVGASGAGKSTLAGILAGTVGGYAGTVRVGRVDVRDASPASLMSTVTTVASGGYLFKGSLRANLLLGARGGKDARPSDQELMDVLARCRIDGFVRENGGLDMPLAEGGSNLSGGQRQRICIARALLHNTPVYIFDEATSNIDVESEQAIGQVISELARDHTVICISHRLSLVEGADCIFMMQDGTIAQAGTHAQLLAADGPYAQLCASQQRLERLSRSFEAADVALEGAYQAQAAAKQDAAAMQQEDAAAQLPQPQQEASVQQASPAARRSGLAVMRDMIGLIGQMRPIMALAIVLGVVGFLAGIFLTTFGAYGLMSGIGQPVGVALAAACALVAVCGVVRGPLRYGEQLANHFIAFKVLAVVRDHVYAALRRLAPAKLEGRDKGDLVSLVTSDIELLEVFYAHTISPVSIAVLVSLAMLAFFAFHSAALALLALVAYAVVGVVMPYVASRASSRLGRQLRDGTGRLNALVLESLRGLRELQQYGRARGRAHLIQRNTTQLGGVELALKRTSAVVAAVAEALIIVADVAFIGLAFRLAGAGDISQASAFVCSAAFMSSFGAVVAIMRLGTGLQPTLASGQRVLDLLDEAPQTVEVQDGADVGFEGAQASHVGFAYPQGAPVIRDASFDVPQNQVLALDGPSGCGKSTMLKLLMRFWDVDEGAVRVSDTDVRDINTACLRSLQGYMTQDAHLFDGTIADNLRIAKADATDAQLREACERAQVLDLVDSLPAGLDTPVGELGDVLSGGERQRIGLARIFLQDAPLMLLDEPTSNLDALNEAAVVDVLMNQRAGKTIVLVSHRASTSQFADSRYTLG